MTTDRKKNGIRRRGERGLTLVEIVIVLFVIMVVAAIVVPNVLSAVANMRLRASAGDLAGLIQQARILAAKNNQPYPVLYGTRNGASIAYVDLNRNGSFDVGEPEIEFSGTTVPAAGAPSGSSGQPPAYVLPGDTGSGSYDNTNTLGYSGRGLPCAYDGSTNPVTCSTPPAKYFTYYLKETRSTGTVWAGVVVTKGGRAKMIVWNGTAWN